VTKEEILDAIKGLNVLELSDLVKALENEFGVSAAAPVAVAAAPSGPSSTANGTEEEERTDFNVMLKEIGENKINVIKAVREVTSLGLKEAKELVESAPTAVREAVGKDEAETIRAKLANAGASVAVE